tara:strand:- start:467 stop:736 length:270 start_codon:yes stop_codon:yes gene_type:complete
MKIMKKKQRHQVKSRWYYIFWGTCTVAVCAGQVLVGSGFRRMSDSLDKILDAPIIIDFGIPRTGRPFMPVPDVWEEELWHPTDPPKRIY